MSTAAAAMTPVRRALSESGVVISFGDIDWEFEPDTAAKKHFWSTDGSECLWCSHQRTPAQIRAWLDAGEPKEDCTVMR